MTNAHHPPYPAYKPSGADWLGDIPAHWEVRRLKFLASVIFSNVDKHSKEEELPIRLCNYVDVYKNEHIVSSLDFMEATAGINEIRKFTLKKGDIIITKDSEEWQDIAVPALVSEELDNVICGYHLALIRPFPNIVGNGYLFRSFQAAAINYQFQVAASGITRYGLGKQALGNSLFLVPPLAEQRAIADYLDRETAQIDALIAKKRALIDLLECQRTALISHAVTRGLNPAVPLKPSGVDWLGEIPAHWEVVPLKYRFDVRLGKMLQSQPLSYYDTKEPYLRAANILWGRVDLSDLKEMWFSPTEKEVYALKTGDLLVSEGGDVGRSAIWKGELENCFFQNAINRVRSRGEHSTKFLFYWLFFLKQAGYIDIICNKSTIAHYTAIKVANTVVALPPPNEEKSIVDYLDRETAQIDALIAKKRELLDLLEHQRTALISHAVTKGLNPAAPLKPSGVDWLGDIPAHWEVRRLKFVARFAYGDSLNVVNREDGNVPVFGSNGIVGTHNEANTFAPCIVIGRKGSFGKVKYSDIPVFAIDTTFYVDSRCTKQDLRWLYYTLGLLGLDESSQDSAVPGLSREFAYNQYVPFPPLAEQRAIAEYLDRETAQIDRLKGEVEASIDLLQRYRTALISAAVTGKIDVRVPAAASCPSA